MNDEFANKIVIVGSCMIDFISYANKLPVAGETVKGNKFQTGFGGKGANQCVAAAKLGGNTAFIARVRLYLKNKTQTKALFTHGNIEDTHKLHTGDDTWGKDYLKSLKDLKVDTSYVQITPGEHSGIAQITVDDAGQNQIVVVGGANEKLSVDDVINAGDVFENGAVVICQLETSVEVALTAISYCRGVSILNAAPAIPNPDPRIFSAPNIFCVNETEASVFTNLPVTNIEEATIAIKALHKKGAKTVILTLGAEGALMSKSDTDGFTHISSPKVSAIDTTGAGDAFIGALAYLIAEYNHNNFTMKKTLEVACDMAAHSVTKLGTQTSFPEEQVMQKYFVVNK